MKFISIPSIYQYFKNCNSYIRARWSRYKISIAPGDFSLLKMGTWAFQLFICPSWTRRLWLTRHPDNEILTPIRYDQFVDGKIKYSYQVMGSLNKVNLIIGRKFWCCFTRKLQFCQNNYEVQWFDFLFWNFDPKTNLTPNTLCQFLLAGGY